MNYGTFTTSSSDTFTVTHAIHIAVKIGTDLKRMQRFYKQPTDDEIKQYEREVIALLKGDYLDKIEYGFKAENGSWRIALKYEARYGGVLIADDNPGKIPIGADISRCKFHSFLIGNNKWHLLTDDEKEKVYENAEISFRRVGGIEPEGNWMYDKTYSAGGRGVVRSCVN